MDEQDDGLKNMMDRSMDEKLEAYKNGQENQMGGWMNGNMDEWKKID